MAYQRYSSYQYETSPRKVQPQYEPKRNTKQKKKASYQKKQVNKKAQVKQKININDRTKTIVYVLVGFAILFAISYRNSQITETFNEKEALKKELSLIQKENEQLEISIENSLNLNNIEQLAKERLGMQKLNNSQKIYIGLDKKDYIEPASEEVIIQEETSLWEKFVNAISKLVK